MEQDIISIIEHWNIGNPKNQLDLSTVKVKYADKDLRIYTLYKGEVKIKALPNNGAWKIINLK